MTERSFGGRVSAAGFECDHFRALGSLIDHDNRLVLVVDLGKCLAARLLIHHQGTEQFPCRRHFPKQGLALALGDLSSPLRP